MPLIKQSILLVSLYCLLSASSVSGAEGKLEINQASAMAGNITGSGGDAPGFPITIDRPGSYLLTGNLQVPSGQMGIVVSVNDVQIDLAGFTVDGGGASGTLLMSSAHNVTVRQGTLIRADAHGLVLSADSMVESVRSIANSGAGIVVGDRGVLRQCHSAANASNGIVVGADARIEHCHVTDNQGVGVQFQVRGAFTHLIVNNNTAGTITGGNDLGHSWCDGVPLCQEACTSLGPEVCDNIDNDCDGLIDEPGAQGCTFYGADVDQDTFGSSALGATACLCAPSEPYTALNNTDCFDGNELARLGQTTFFTTDRGDGSYDFNCDGQATKQFTDTGRCGLPPVCGFTSGWAGGTVANCGVSAPYLIGCSGLSCTSSTETRTQGCR